MKLLDDFVVLARGNFLNIKKDAKRPYHVIVEIPIYFYSRFYSIWSNDSYLEIQLLKKNGDPDNRSPSRSFGDTKTAVNYLIKKQKKESKCLNPISSQQGKSVKIE